MNKIVKLFEEHETEIIDACIWAYKEAWENRYLQYEIEVQIDANNNFETINNFNVVVWYQNQGRNSFHVSENGIHIIKIMTICHTFSEIICNENETEEEFIQADIDNWAYDYVYNKYLEKLESLEEEYCKYS